MLNRENWIRLRDRLIRDEEHHFNMAFFVVGNGPENPCDTVACMAGHIVWEVDGIEQLWGLDLDPGALLGSGVATRAAELLGLDATEARYVFLGHWQLDEVTREAAIAYCNQVIATGTLAPWDSDQFPA